MGDRLQQIVQGTSGVTGNRGLARFVLSSVGNSAADRLIDKLRDFATTLDPDERVLLGLLLAPGVARAYAEEAEVTGFAFTEWSPDALPESLGVALRSRGIVVTGFEPGPDAGAGTNPDDDCEGADPDDGPEPDDSADSDSDPDGADPDGADPGGSAEPGLDGRP